MDIWKSAVGALLLSVSAVVALQASLVNARTPLLMAGIGWFVTACGMVLVGTVKKERTV